MHFCKIGQKLNKIEHISIYNNNIIGICNWLSNYYSLNERKFDSTNKIQK